MNGYKPLVSKDFTELEILQLFTFSYFLESDCLFIQLFYLREGSL